MLSRPLASDQPGNRPESFSEETAPPVKLASDSLAARLGGCFIPGGLASSRSPHTSATAVTDSAASIEVRQGKLRTTALKGQRSIKTLFQAPVSKLRQVARTCTGGYKQAAAEELAARRDSARRKIALDCLGQPSNKSQAHQRRAGTFTSPQSLSRRSPHKQQSTTGRYTSPGPLTSASLHSHSRRHTFAGSVRPSQASPASSTTAAAAGASVTTRQAASRKHSARTARLRLPPRPPKARPSRQAQPLQQASAENKAPAPAAASDSSAANPFLLASSEPFQEPAGASMTADSHHSNASNFSNSATSSSMPSAFQMSTGASAPVEAARPLQAPPSFATWEPADVQICRRPDGSPWKLGDGGSSSVYKGILCNMYTVAIKVVSDSTVTQKQNFKREVEILSNLRCPNVLSFVGACHLPGRTMLISEFCQRGDLYHALAADRDTRMLSWYRRGKAIAIDIAKGLSFMHRNHVIHFDIKSPNILLDDACTAKIADVGIAKYSVRDLTSLGQAFGSWDWASPEQIMCEECSVRTDLYSLGVVLWEIVTGERPNRNKMRAVRVPEECPQDVADLIAACRSNSPVPRPTAQQVLEVLQGSSGPDGKEGAQLPPPSYLCPITGQLMQDPVILVETGVTFEKQAIKDWFKKGKHRTCPATNRPVDHVQLVSNLGMRQAISNWRGPSEEEDGTDLLGTQFSVASTQKDMQRTFTGPVTAITSAPRSSVLVGTPRSGSSSGQKRSAGGRLSRLPGSVPSGLSRSALRHHASNGNGAGPSRSESAELGHEHPEPRMLNGHANGHARPPSVESLSMSEAGPSHRSASLPLPSGLPLVRRGSLGSPQPSIPPTLVSSLRHCVSTSQRKLADNMFLANIDGRLEEEPGGPSHSAAASSPQQPQPSRPNAILSRAHDEDLIPQDPLHEPLRDSSSSFSSSRTSSETDRGDDLLPEWVAALHRQSNTAFAAAACALCRLIDKQPRNLLQIVLVICREDHLVARDVQDAATNASVSPAGRSDIIKTSMQLLVRLVESGSRKLQVSAAHVLGALVQNARVQRSLLVEVRAAEALTAGVTSSSTCAQWACCRAIEFLAYLDQQHAAQLLSKGLLKHSLGPLVQVIEAPKSPPAKKHAVMALGHLASNVSSRQQIMRSGAIPHLIKDLELTESPVSQEAATYALHRLGDSLETHMLMLRCEVLSHTMPLLGEASSKTQQYAASLLVALATGEKSARRAMLPLDVFGKALCLLRSNTPRLQLAGIDLLAVIVQDSAGREAIQRSDVHLSLSGMLHDADARSMASAALRILLDCKAFSVEDLQTAGVDDALLTRLQSNAQGDRSSGGEGVAKSPSTGSKAWKLLFRQRSAGVA